jgi:8-oxo-dGTP pyrophosphatase MutT (NUDIX family)
VAIRQPVQVLVYPVCTTTRAREYLLLHRVAMPHFGLGAFWQGISGGVEIGESVSQAAARELSEETGLTASRLEPIGYSYSFPIQEEWRTLHERGVQESRLRAACVAFQAACTRRPG